MSSQKSARLARHSAPGIIEPPEADSRPPAPWPGPVRDLRHPGVGSTLRRTLSPSEGEAIIRIVMGYIQEDLRSVGSRQNRMESRVEKLESRIEYVQPRFEPEGATSLAKTIEELEKQVSALRAALDTDDDVKKHAEYLSLKVQLSHVRASFSPTSELRFAFGSLHDALVFTGFRHLDARRMDAFEAALGLTTSNQQSEEILRDVQCCLEKAGFELVPVDD